MKTVYFFKRNRFGEAFCLLIFLLWGNCTYAQTNGYEKKSPNDSINFQWVIPNSFSPNGDGKNDFFKIFHIKTNTSYQCYIFDAQGTEVGFIGSLIPEWDGTSKGMPLPKGIYFYNCMINNKSKNGTVHIVR